MKKMVVNHLEKIFVTSDAATILSEIQIQHPAAAMIAMAAKMQEYECGDYTNYVISFAGELLNQAEKLIKMGLHPSDVVGGYEIALKECLRFLESYEEGVQKVEDFMKQENVKPLIESVLCSKLPNYYKHFSEIVSKACINCLPDTPAEFNVSHVRVVKILGGSLGDQKLVNGMVMTRPPLGTILKAQKCKVACYSCPFEIEGGETKGTIVIKTAEDLLNFSKSEENYLDKTIKAIADTGAKVVVVGGSVNQLALHYLEKYELMCIKLTQRWDMKRLCNCIGAVAIPAFGAPTQEELGFCESVKVTEIGSDKVTIFKKDENDTKLVTLLLRGGTKTLLDDAERAIQDGVHAFKNLIRDNRVVPGAGSIEMYLANYLNSEAEKITTLEQYSYARFAQSFEVVVKHLANNAGLDANITIPDMYAGNVDGPKTGIHVLENKMSPISEIGIIDHLKSKIWAIQLAADAAMTILRIDQIIVAKPAGGPKVPQNTGWDND